MFAALLAAAVTSAAIPVCASTFTIGGSGTMFTIDRSGDGTNFAETVHYRTVSLSAYAGQHFTEMIGTHHFAPGDTSTNIVIMHKSPTSAYSFQTGNSRSYRFEITDAGGFPITNATRALTTGTSVNGSNAFGEKALAINTGTITVADGGYDQAYHSANVNNYFSAAAPRDYLVAAGAQLRATVTFHAREKDDGYQYVAIYANTSTSNVDTGAKDGDPGSVNHSHYMAGFTIDGSVSTAWCPYTFPLTSKGNACGEQTHTWSGNSNGNLKQQYFNANCRAADGRLVLPTSLTSLHVRLNASGNLSDTWYASNVVAHVQAVDTNAPTVLVVSAAPGIHAKGNAIYVSVAFSEPVTGSPSLSTSWGTLNYFSGSGSNVLTFKGTIPADATDTLNVTGKIGTISDLAGKEFTGGIDARSLATLDSSHVYAITYDLAGGALPEGASNHDTYTYETPSFTLAPPVRPCYVFAGWTGTGISGLTNAVTVVAQSHGDRAYVANWTPITYSVHFDAGAADATGPMPDQTLTYDAPQALSSNAFTRTGYTFAGWRGADGTIYPDGATVLNLTNAQDAVVSLTATCRPNIPYIDADGTERICTDYTVITNAVGNATYGTNGAESWHVVTNAVSISGQLYFRDNITHLILCDGATLAVTNANDAIQAYDLTIYCQTNGTGTVTATGAFAGIAANSVTINGGTVTATGGTGISAHFAAIGNHHLLKAHPILQVQCSRRFFAYARDNAGKLLKDAPPRLETDEFRESAEALLEEAAHGAVLVSPCISEGEREIARRAFAAGRRVITLANKSFPPLYKPGGKLFDACAAGSLLMLAPINWPYLPGEKKMTREDACALNRIAQLIAGPGAVEIVYKGIRPENVDHIARDAVAAA